MHWFQSIDLICSIFSDISTSYSGVSTLDICSKEVPGSGKIGLFKFTQFVSNWTVLLFVEHLFLLHLSSHIFCTPLVFYIFQCFSISLIHKYFLLKPIGPVKCRTKIKFNFQFGRWVLWFRKRKPPRSRTYRDEIRNIDETRTLKRWTYEIVFICVTKMRYIKRYIPILTAVKLKNLPFFFFSLELVPFIFLR